jgi:hypothetical protein
MSLCSLSSIVKSVGMARMLAQQHENAEINIFTVASGLLYEVRKCRPNYTIVLSS